MPRTEPLNEKIIQALQSRKRRAELLNQQKQYQYGKAIQLITEFRGNITRISQLTGLCKKGKITKPIFDEIEDVMSGNADVDVPAPSPAAQARAQARGPAEQRLPGLGTGAAAILLVLYRESLKPNGARFMTKEQLQDRATRELHVNMYDESGGYSRWSGIKTLEDNQWVKRDAYSRMYGGSGSGRFGGRKDQFSITEDGKAAAAKLETQLSRQPGGLAAVVGTPGRPAGAAGSSQYRSSTGAAYRTAAGGGDDNSEQDPFAALLGGILTGPEFTGTAAARMQQPSNGAAGAAGGGSSPFLGRGHVLGQRAGSYGNSNVAAAAAGGVAGLEAQDYLDEDLEYVDPEGFPIYRPELFEDSSPPRAQHTQEAQQPQQPRPPPARAPAAAAPRPPATAAGVGGPASDGLSTAALRGLMPKVRKRDKREPLCAPDSGCAPCKLLQQFLQDVRATRAPMIISKKQQQHVQQRVAYLAAAEGGNWPVSVLLSEDKTLVVEKQQHGVAGAAAATPTPGGAAGRLDPLAELSKMLGNKPALHQEQQQQQPQQHRLVAKQPAAAPSPATATAAHEPPPAAAAAVADSQQGRQLTPAQMAAAAAEARAKQQEQQVHQHRVQHKQQQQQPSRPAQQEQPIILDSQLDEMGDVSADYAPEGLHSPPCYTDQPVDLLLGSQEKSAGVVPPTAGPAADATMRKRRRTLQDSSAAAIGQPAVEPGGSVDLLQDSQQQDVAMLDGQQPAKDDYGNKRQRQQLQHRHSQVQQHQHSSECISLLESQDVDWFAADLDAAEGHNELPGSTGQQPRHNPAAVEATGARQTAPHMQRTAAGVGGSSSSSSSVELKLVVDDKERRTNSAPNQVYQYIRQDCAKLLQAGLPPHITVDIDRDELPLGDYAWLLLHQEHNSGVRGPAAAAVDDDSNSDDEAAAAGERSQCVVAGAVVERKVIRDIVGRSAGGDHIRQLQRMYQFRDVLPHQLLIIENLTQLAQNYLVYSSRGSSWSHTAIYDEATLFDFIVRAAVSSYGNTQKILLAPSTGDTRSILLAITQLLIYELQHKQHHQQHAGQQHEAAGELTYPELKKQVNEVNRRLPRWDVPVELAHQGAADVVPPDTAFRVTAGQGQFEGLKLYSHRTYTGSNHLHVTYVEGRKLLILLDSFHKQAMLEAGNEPTAQHEPTAQLSVVQAVEVALEMGVLLASLLDAFVAESAAATTGVEAAAGGGGGGDSSSSSCRVLLVENLVGPTGALTYMQKAQQAAAIHSCKPATKKAAERQAEMCQLDGAAVSQHLWLWLVCFALKQGWHVQLCQSANSVGLFLQTAGSRCCCFAQQLEQAGRDSSRRQELQEQQEPGLQQQQQLPAQQQQHQQQRGQPELVIADSEGEDDDGVGHHHAAAAAAETGACAAGGPAATGGHMQALL